MAPWNPFSVPGSDAEALPSSMEPAVRGVDTAFEVFIDGALTKLYNEASGRSKEQKALRAACKKVLGAHPLWRDGEALRRAFCYGASVTLLVVPISSLHWADAYDD